MTLSDIIGIVLSLAVAGDIAATLVMKGKVNSIQLDLRQALATQAQHATALAVMDNELRRLAAEFSSIKLRYEDLTGFLQGQGFRKRDGPGPSQ